MCCKLAMQTKYSIRLIRKRIFCRFEATLMRETPDRITISIPNPQCTKTVSLMYSTVLHMCGQTNNLFPSVFLFTNSSIIMFSDSLASWNFASYDDNLIYMVNFKFVIAFFILLSDITPLSYIIGQRISNRHSSLINWNLKA